MTTRGLPTADIWPTAARVPDPEYEEADSERREPRRITTLLPLDGEGWISDRPRHVFVVDLVTGDKAQLTKARRDHNGLGWRPDSRAIAFAALPPTSSSNRWHVSRVVDLDGAVTRLTRGATAIYDAPSWSPDGSLLAHRVTALEGSRDISIGAFGRARLSPTASWVSPSFGSSSVRSWKCRIGSSPSRPSTTSGSFPASRSRRWRQPSCSRSPSSSLPARSSFSRGATSPAPSAWQLRAAARSSVVEDRQVAEGKPLRVGKDVELDDLALADGSGGDRERVPAAEGDRPGKAVDQRRRMSSPSWA
jgi:Tol biopolymer transport system component